MNTPELGKGGSPRTSTPPSCHPKGLFPSVPHLFAPAPNKGSGWWSALPGSLQSSLTWGVLGGAACLLPTRGAG